MKIKRKPVLVRWVDSGSTHGWQHPDDVHQTSMRCETLGWLVSRDKKQITIALNAVFDGSSAAPFGQYITIPMCAVKSIRKVKL